MRDYLNRPVISQVLQRAAFALLAPLALSACATNAETRSATRTPAQDLRDRIRANWETATKYAPEPPVIVGGVGGGLGAQRSPMERALSHGWFLQTFATHAALKDAGARVPSASDFADSHAFGMEPPLDDYGRPFRILLDGATVLAWGAGTDGCFETADDEYGVGGHAGFVAYMPSALRAKHEDEVLEVRGHLRQRAAARPPAEATPAAPEAVRARILANWTKVTKQQRARPTSPEVRAAPPDLSTPMSCALEHGRRLLTLSKIDGVEAAVALLEELGVKAPHDEHGLHFRIGLDEEAVYAWGAGEDGRFDTADDEYGLSLPPSWNDVPQDVREKLFAELRRALRWDLRK